MKVTIYLKYNTHWGEMIFISGDAEELKGPDGRGLPLNYTGAYWKVSFQTKEKSFSYSFSIEENGITSFTESSHCHRADFSANNYKEIVIYDYIDTKPKISRMMESAVFTKAIRYHKTLTEKKNKIKVPIVFHTKTSQINFNHNINIIGNCKSLGNWEKKNSVKMNASSYPHFNKTLDANKITFPLEYKYVITNQDNTIILWETGDNHYLCPEFSSNTDCIVVNDPTPEFNLPEFKGAGTAIPIFSLRTKESFGCGEFNDLKKLADWCYKTGQRIIQTLPINDTTVHGTWRDSYPYSAISVHALHPIYLNIEKIGSLKDPQKYKAIQKRLNQKKFVDYEAVNQYKWEFIHELYDQLSEETFSERDYIHFFEQNKSWLKPYAVFSYLRYKFNTSDFSKWGDDKTFSLKRINDYCQPNHKAYKHVAVHFFVQYHLHKQLSEATQYVHSKGIALKGDIPIGVNRHSIDVWQYPSLFDCNGSAGAPPDYFSKTGQIWGFPIYNWEEMEKDNYQWWKKRFKSMSHYFDAYRIDHILGFFRIFRTPTTARMGLLGQFTPALPLTPKEIESYGIPFNREKLCKPIINDEVLEKIFGDKKAIVKQRYLVQIGDDSFQLKTEVENHELIENLFKTKQDEEIKKGLFYLCCQVLFVEDYQVKGKFHPRISIEQSYLFSTLSTETQEKIKRLYDEFYYTRHNEFWKHEAIKKLTPLINSTDMMVCGEDLGMIPQCVPTVMREQEILSLEIQRMPKEMFVEFENLNKIPFASVCTTSTHDMSTMRQWWEEDRASIQRYFLNELHQNGEAPQHCEPWISQQIIQKHLHSPAAWVIIPIQDWFAIDEEVRWDQTFNERINDPSNPDNYWRYRMHISLEDLIKKEEFNRRIKHMIQSNNR